MFWVESNYTLVICSMSYILSILWGASHPQKERELEMEQVENPRERRMNDKNIQIAIEMLNEWRQACLISDDQKSRKARDSTSDVTSTQNLTAKQKQSKRERYTCGRLRSPGSQIFI